MLRALSSASVAWTSTAANVVSARDALGNTTAFAYDGNDRLIATGYRFLYPTFREGYEMVIDGWNDGS